MGAHVQTQRPRLEARALKQEVKGCSQDTDAVGGGGGMQSYSPGAGQTGRTLTQ